MYLTFAPTFVNDMMHVFQLMDYPHFMEFWYYKDLRQEWKLTVLKGVAQRVSIRERHYKFEAQVSY